MELDSHPGLVMTPAVCIDRPRQIRKAQRATRDALIDIAGQQRTSEVWFAQYHGADAARNALSNLVADADPSPAELAHLDQVHTFLAQLAANPADVYALVDELLPVVYELSRVYDRLAGQLNDWADLASSRGRAGDVPQRLHTAASQLGMHSANHACWAHQRMEDALAALDRPRYRADRGIPLDWKPSR